jgi:hypothetical protein
MFPQNNDARSEEKYNFMEKITNQFLSCKEPTMGTIMSFNEKKTVKVSGVSQLLRDQFEKEFQTKGNSTGYNDEVNKLHVCPNGKDHVFVEFVRDISGNFQVVAHLNITLEQVFK